MSFTLIMAVTAAVAATMGFMAARRRGEDDEDDEGNEAPPRDGPSSAAKKAEPKHRAPADPKAAFAGMPLMLGDVVSADHEERWLAGALLAREGGHAVAALFLAPEG